MSRSNSNNRGGGLGLCGVLTIVFVVLKFTGVIDWSWLWVLSPLWINLIVCVIVIGFFILVCNKPYSSKFKRSDRIKW